MEIARSKAWADDSGTLLTDFPAIEACTALQVYTAFEADILMSEYQVLKTRLDKLDLSEFMLSYVDEMGGAYFSDNRKQIKRENDAEEVVTEIPLSEDPPEKLSLTISKEAFGDKNAITMLDDKDQRILFEIIRLALADVASGVRPITIEIGDLAKIISNNPKPNQYYYDEAEQRCYKIVNFSYNKFNEKGERIGAVNFLSAALRGEKDGKACLNITLGATVSDAIINNKVRHLPSASYDVLTNKTARIMILTLQKERILAGVRFRDGIIDECATRFGYSDFLSMVNFGDRNRNKNMRTVKEALTDLRDHHVIVKDFEVSISARIAKIWWEPLTEEEYKNLSWYGYDGEKLLEEIK